MVSQRSLKYDELEYLLVEKISWWWTETSISHMEYLREEKQITIESLFWQKTQKLKIWFYSESY